MNVTGKSVEFNLQDGLDHTSLRLRNYLEVIKKNKRGKLQFRNNI